MMSEAEEEELEEEGRPDRWEIRILCYTWLIELEFLLQQQWSLRALDLYLEKGNHSIPIPIRYPCHQINSCMF